MALRTVCGLAPLRSPTPGGAARRRSSSRRREGLDDVVGRARLQCLRDGLAAAAHKKLVEIEQEIQEATAKHNGFLKELGLSPLPAPD